MRSDEPTTKNCFFIWRLCGVGSFRSASKQRMARSREREQTDQRLIWWIARAIDREQQLHSATYSFRADDNIQCWLSNDRSIDRSIHQVFFPFFSFCLVSIFGCARCGASFWEWTLKAAAIIMRRELPQERLGTHTTHTTYRSKCKEILCWSYPVDRLIDRSADSLLFA